MSDDIVDPLGDLLRSVADPALVRAADEIVRLRTRVAELEADPRLQPHHITGPMEPAVWPPPVRRHP